MKTASPAAIQIFGALTSGDASLARSLAGGKTSWTIADARTILGGGLEMSRRYGVDGTSIARSIMGW